MRSPSRRVATRALVVFLPGLCCSTANSQNIVKQPDSRFLFVEILSMRNEVKLRPGDLIDPPYLVRSWSAAPKITFTRRGQVGVLGIRDPAAGADFIPDRSYWELELMPVVPVAVRIRLEEGRGNFDLSGIRVQEIDLFNEAATTQIAFQAPNPVRLQLLQATVYSGSLEVQGLLNARPERVDLLLPQSKCRLEFVGAAFDGEMQVALRGAPQSLFVALPRQIGVRIEGAPNSVLRFGADHLERAGPSLVSRGFASSRCRVVLRIDDAIEDLVVRWDGSVAAAPAAPPESPRAADALAERFGEVFNRVEQQRYTEARRQFEQLRAEAPDDPRIPVLERWMLSAERETPRAARTGAQVDAEEAFAHGLDAFLQGQYAAALEIFRGVRQLDPERADVDAWLRRTQSELQRFEDARRTQTLSRDPLQTESPAAAAIDDPPGVAPVLAIRSPPAAVTRLRRDTIALEGMAGDDRGVDRIEVAVNGVRLQDASGNPWAIRDSTGAAPRQLSFARAIPLSLGENQIVVTAYDRDETRPNWTSEQLTVLRRPPWHRTAAFGIGLGALAFVGLMTWLVVSIVKYRIAIVHRYNPYIAGAPVRDRSMLFGRDKLLDSVLQTLHSNSIMLHGPRRIGKTSLQHALKRRLETARDPELDYVPVFIDLEGVQADALFATLIEDIAEACRPRIGRIAHVPSAAAANGYSSREFARDLRDLLSALRARSDRRVKLVLLLDEVDQLNQYGDVVNQKLRSIFMKTFAEDFVAVLTGTHINKKWQSEGSPWYNFFEEIEVRPLERQEAARLVREPVHGIFRYDEDAVARILDHSQCEPYLVQRYCVHVINRIIEHKRRRVRVEDVEFVHEALTANAEVA